LLSTIPIPVITNAVKLIFSQILPNIRNDIASFDCFQVCLLLLMIVQSSGTSCLGSHVIIELVHLVGFIIINKILEIEKGSTSSHSGELASEEALKQERLRNE
jgi:hypothetical protein